MALFNGDHDKVRYDIDLTDSRWTVVWSMQYMHIMY
jgi:hypothetical protein